MRYKGTKMVHVQDRVGLEQVNQQEWKARQMLYEAGFFVFCFFCVHVCFFWVLFFFVLIAQNRKFFFFFFFLENDKGKQKTHTQTHI